MKLPRQFMLYFSDELGPRFLPNPTTATRNFTGMNDSIQKKFTTANPYSSRGRTGEELAISFHQVSHSNSSTSTAVPSTTLKAELESMIHIEWCNSNDSKARGTIETGKLTKDSTFQYVAWKCIMSWNNHSAISTTEDSGSLLSSKIPRQPADDQTGRTHPRSL